VRYHHYHISPESGTFVHLKTCWLGVHHDPDSLNTYSGFLKTAVIKSPIRDVIFELRFGFKNGPLSEGEYFSTEQKATEPSQKLNATISNFKQATFNNKVPSKKRRRKPHQLNDIEELNVIN
jgi:hypothetical protein